MAIRESILEFYRSPAKMTSPGAYAPEVVSLPRDVPTLARIAQGLLLHEHIAPAYGVELAERRRSETHTRTAEQILGLAYHHDGRPLADSRAVDDRVVGTCRNFTVLLVTLLRAQGAPARARCGFRRLLRAGQVHRPLGGRNVGAAQKQLGPGRRSTGRCAAFAVQGRFRPA